MHGKVCEPYFGSSHGSSIRGVDVVVSLQLIIKHN